MKLTDYHPSVLVHLSNMANNYTIKSDQETATSILAA